MNRWRMKTTLSCITAKANATANSASSKSAKNAVKVQRMKFRILRHVVNVEQSYASRIPRSGKVVVSGSVSAAAKEYAKNAMTLSIIQKTTFAYALVRVTVG